MQTTIAAGYSTPTLATFRSWGKVQQELVVRFADAKVGRILDLEIEEGEKM